MRNKHNGGFSLIEVLVAIVLLGLIVIPISSSMLVAHRINAKTEALLQAELAVSSAAEHVRAGWLPSGQFSLDGCTNQLSKDIDGKTLNFYHEDLCIYKESATVTISSNSFNDVTLTVYVGGGT